VTERENRRRDQQRSKVYAAEEFVRLLFDRAAQHGSGAIDFFGTPLTLPPEGRFGSVASVQRYVDEVLAMPAIHERWGAPAPLAVRRRRASTAAHYETRDGAGVIAVSGAEGSGSSSDWAMRELVVLHEIAHHLCVGEEPAHGSEFVATYCELASLVMGAEVGYVLRVVYANEGVR
jgi:putative metallohydrolase (TIGR04338 family)